MNYEELLNKVEKDQASKKPATIGNTIKQAQVKLDQFGSEYAALEAQKKQIMERQAALKESAQEILNDLGMKNGETPYGMFIVTEGSSKESLISWKDLQKKDPDMSNILRAKGYVKVTDTEPSISFRTKESKEKTVTDDKAPAKKSKSTPKPVQGLDTPTHSL